MTAFIFDASKVEPDQGRIGALPKGWYKTMVEKTELKLTNDGAGQIFNVMFTVVDGLHKGAKFFNGFNVVNNSEKATEIGHKQLSALCHAVGVLQMTDTDQIKNIPFFTRLKFVAAEMDPQDSTKVKYEEKNEPTAYRNINDQAAIEAISKQGATGQTGPASAPMAPPPQMAPAAQVPQQWAQPVQQPAQPPQQWQQPPVQQQQAAVQQMQQAPVQQQQAPMQPQPWQQPANAQPWQDPNAGYNPAQQQQAAQPWQDPNAGQQQYAPNTAAPVQGQTFAPSQGGAPAQMQAPQQQTAPNAPPPWVHPQQ